MGLADNSEYKRLRNTQNLLQANEWTKDKLLKMLLDNRSSDWRNRIGGFHQFKQEREKEEKL